MQTFTANEAKTRFGKFIDLAQNKPVRVTRRGRLVGVMVSASDYEAMRVFYAERLKHSLNVSAERAKAQGLTEGMLAVLLKD